MGPPLVRPEDRFVYLLTCLACIGGFLFGYDTGIISAALLGLQDDLHLSHLQEEVVVAATVGAAMLGALAGGQLSDAYGRKPVVLVSSVIFACGAILMAIAPGYVVLVVGRIVVGVGVGLSSMSVPVYVSEAAPSETRGFFVTCVNLAITGGQFVAGVVGGALSGVHEGWRYMLGLAAVPALVQLVGFMGMPESPRWLLRNVDISEARRALSKIRGTADVDEELSDITAAVQEEKAVGGGGLRELFATAATRRALLVGCALQAAQQLAGINTVMYYSATILKLAGFTSDSEAIWLAACVAFLNFAGSGLGLYLVERKGRRVLTLGSLTLVVLALAALSVSFRVAQHDTPHLTGLKECDKYHYCFDCVVDDDCGYCSHTTEPDHPSSFKGCVPGNDDHARNRSSFSCPNSDYDYNSCPGSNWGGWLIFGCLLLYIVTFAPGMGTMPWTINSEIYPLRVRGVGNSLATTTNWTCNLFISLTFLTLTDKLSKSGAFALYAVIALAFLILLYCRLPETAGRSLEEIQELFEPGAGRSSFLVNRTSSAEEDDNAVDNDSGRDPDTQGLLGRSPHRPVKDSSFGPGSPEYRQGGGGGGSAAGGEFGDGYGGGAGPTVVWPGRKPQGPGGSDSVYGVGEGGGEIPHDAKSVGSMSANSSIAGSFYSMRGDEDNSVLSAGVRSPGALEGSGFDVPNSGEALLSPEEQAHYLQQQLQMQRQQQQQQQMYSMNGGGSGGGNDGVEEESAPRYHPYHHRFRQTDGVSVGVSPAGDGKKKTSKSRSWRRKTREPSEDEWSNTMMSDSERAVQRLHARMPSAEREELGLEPGIGGIHGGGGGGNGGGGGVVGISGAGDRTNDTRDARRGSRPLNDAEDVMSPAIL